MHVMRDFFARYFGDLSLPSFSFFFKPFFPAVQSFKLLCEDGTPPTDGSLSPACYSFPFLFWTAARDMMNLLEFYSPFLQEHFRSCGARCRPQINFQRGVLSHLFVKNHGHGFTSGTRMQSKTIRLWVYFFFFFLFENLCLLCDTIPLFMFVTDLCWLLALPLVALFRSLSTSTQFDIFCCT